MKTTILSIVLISGLAVTATLYWTNGDNQNSTNDVAAEVGHAKTADKSDDVMTLDANLAPPPENAVPAHTLNVDEKRSVLSATLEPAQE